MKCKMLREGYLIYLTQADFPQGGSLACLTVHFQCTIIQPSSYFLSFKRLPKSTSLFFHTSNSRANGDYPRDDVIPYSKLGFENALIKA